MAGCNVKHTIGADEGDGGALNANQSNLNCHIAVFSRTGLQCHRYFDVLDIVIVEGEHTIIIAGDFGGIITALKARYLEILINSTAIFNGHRTGTGNVTPSIKVSAVIYGNIRFGFHLYEANRTGYTTGIGGVRRHTAGNAHCTINHNVRTGFHRQSAICTGLHLSFQQGGLSSAQSVRCIIRNQQCDTCGNGIIACRQSTVVRQNNGLVCNACYCSHSLVQIFIQAVAVYKEACILCKHRANSHIVSGFQSKCLFLVQNHMAFAINPAQESNSTCRGRNQSGTCAGNIHLSAIIYRSPCNGNAAQSAVISKGNRRRFLCNLTSKAFHNQLVGSVVLCGGDGNSKAFTGFHNLFKAAGAAAISCTVNLQLVYAACGPVKGDLCLAAAFIINGSSCGLSRCTKAQDTTTALCSHGNRTIGHGVIGCAGNADSYTGNGSVGTGSSSKQSNFAKLIHCIAKHAISLLIHICKDVICVCLGSSLTGFCQSIHFIHSRKEFIVALFVHSVEDFLFTHFAIDAVAVYNGIDTIHQFHSQCGRFFGLFLCSLRRLHRGFICLVFLIAFATFTHIHGIAAVDFVFDYCFHISMFVIQNDFGFTCDNVIMDMLIAVCCQYLHRYHGNDHDQCHHERKPSLCLFRQH